MNLTSDFPSYAAKGIQLIAIPPLYSPVFKDEKGRAVIDYRLPFSITHSSSS